MGIEIDFLPVGNGEKSGDAIALRFGNLFGSRNEQIVMVVDGGTQDSGQALVEHIRAYYGTDTVDIVLSTHPDGDHASGLNVVMDELVVGQLWMHRPWEHCTDISELFYDGRITDDSISDGLREDLEHAWELEKIARRKRIRIVEPFCDGEVNRILPGNVAVLGPSLEFYEGLLPHFRDMPEVNEAVLAYLRKAMNSFAEGVSNLATKIAEGWGYETLADPEEDATSAENNSSTVVLIGYENHQLLLTGDAGVPALEKAADFAEFHGIDLRAVDFSQIPHHGSKRNVGPGILDRILGPKLSARSLTKSAFVSAAKKGMPKHPAKKVTNAYQRRGFKVVATQGTTKHFHRNAPARQGWTTADLVPFFTEVDE